MTASTAETSCGQKSGDSTGAARVLLLVQSTADRRLLREELARQYDVVVPSESERALADVGTTVDLCILDTASLTRHHEALAALKDQVRPVFLPFLLVRPHSESEATPRLAEGLVDDVLDLPVGKARLRRRIEAVLSTRRLSLELARQNERLEEFASVLSHDLRNPIAIAEGYLEQARETGEDEHFDRVANALDRMHGLVDDVLALARSDDPANDRESWSVAAVADAAWETVETESATLTVADDRPIIADRGRLRQVFENLFRNAVEHGGDDVTVTVGSLPSGFYVEDDGPGIPADQADAVFERGVSSRPAGTGFGLAIVRRIADAHDWTVRVTEGRDGGARFEITGCDPATTDGRA